jgi:hypothetical protein
MSLAIYTQYPKMTKQKQVFRNVCISAALHQSGLDGRVAGQKAVMAVGRRIKVQRGTCSSLLLELNTD